ncbi:E3 SUMO-protein ligase NSE2-like [Drosophila eugracilis]|uniref:E3 SUMO-protein ligase NSE2-like n=1 Tax=Drosophila eugracilis TaxID=29029 RepID=UPI001BDAF811|nr:E3 SUMO-protein ligase NSE2-like [Drosophila eugracilis]
MEFNQHVDSALCTFVDNTKFFKEMADVMSKIRDDEEMQKLLEESAQIRLEHGEKLIQLKSKNQKLKQAMHQAKNESATIEEFEGNWNQRRKAVEKIRINAKKTVDFKNFEKSLTAQVSGKNCGTVGLDQDDDITEGIEETGGEIFSLFDPWSKALMKNPVRNKNCGHIYDRDSVMLIIKDNIGVRCPVLGCANKTYIQPSHLVEDTIVRQKVQQKLAEDAESYDDSSSE